MQDGSRGRLRALWIALAVTGLGLAAIGVVLFQLAQWLSIDRGGHPVAAHAAPPDRASAAWNAAKRALLSTPGSDEEPSAVPADHPFARTQITGRVYDAEDSTGIAGARVQIRSSWGVPHLGPEAGDGSVRFTTHSDGTYAMLGIPPGSFDVEVSAQGYLVTRFSFRKFSTVEDDGGFDFAMFRAASLSGRVLSHGEPVAGATVLAFTGDGALMVRADEPRATTGDDGRFVLDAVDERGVSLLAAHPGFQPGVRAIGSAEIGHEVIIELDAGTEIPGRVVGPEGPIAGARISIEYVAPAFEGRGLRIGDRLAPVVSDMLGHFALPFDIGTSGGVLGLRAEAPGYQTVHRHWRLTAALPPALELRLDHDAPFSGRVIAHDGRPVAHARVTVNTPALRAIQGVTDERGRFDLEGLPAEPPYQVVIEHPDHPSLIRSEESNDGPHEYQLASESRILTQLLDARTRQPITRYSFVIEGPVRLQSGAVSLSGALEIDQLVAGSYVLMVRAEGYQPAVIENLVLSEGETAKPPAITLRPGGRVVGRAKGSWDGELYVDVILDGTSAGSGIVDHDGNFVVQDLPDGLYSVVASGSGVSALLPNVRVAEGQTVSVELQLVPIDRDLQ